MATNNKSEKRRGRPPKNLVVSTPVKNKILVKEPQEEQLVLYLPNFDDDQSEKSERRLISKDTETEKNNFTSDSDSDEDIEQITKYKFNHLTDKCDSEDNDNIKSSNNLNKSIEKLLEELHRRDAIIQNLKSRMKDKSLFNENTLTLTKENKKHLINLGLISINKNKLNICDKTSIACWWCTYNFETQPLFMPDHYKNNFYYVFGNFCGFGCMIAYNKDMDDYRKSVRSALIKQLYCDIFQCDEMNIKAAGPREILEKFGGIMTINKFRDPMTVSSKVIKMSIPPMIPLISDYEEIVIDK
jgi:hypothetical protein